MKIFLESTYKKSLGLTISFPLKLLSHIQISTKFLT